MCSSDLSWVVESCKRAHADTGRPIVVDPKSPTAGVIDRLEEAGVPLVRVGFPEFAQACIALQDAVSNERVRHLGQDRLTSAVAGAAIRTFGESWVFSARASDVDITPLLSIVLALGALQTKSATKPVFAF